MFMCIKVPVSQNVNFFSDDVYVYMHYAYIQGGVLLYITDITYFNPGRVRSIVMSMSVCLSAHVTR